MKKTNKAEEAPAKQPSKPGKKEGGGAEPAAKKAPAVPIDPSPEGQIRLWLEKSLSLNTFPKM